jgi:nitrogen fixation/metabolism regulation signal transduction histidine kinase
MTSQLDEARRDNERHRAELEAARAYLESILANLSAGVLVFDRRFVLRTVNEGALTILADDFTSLLGESDRCLATPAGSRSGHHRDAFAETTGTEWQEQIELDHPDGPATDRCSCAHAAS